MGGGKKTQYQDSGRLRKEYQRIRLLPQPPELKKAYRGRRYANNSVSTPSRFSTIATTNWRSAPAQTEPAKSLRAACIFPRPFAGAPAERRNNREEAALAHPKGPFPQEA